MFLQFVINVLPNTYAFVFQQVWAVKLLVFSRFLLVSCPFIPSLYSLWNDGSPSRMQSTWTSAWSCEQRHR